MNGLRRIAMPIIQPIDPSKVSKTSKTTKTTKTFDKFKQYQEQPEQKNRNEIVTKYPWITNEFLRTYLAYVDNTESPRLMHIWSVVACAGAALGRHAWIETGLGKMYGNQYILLVGPPGTRKSTAINLAKNRLTNATSVRLAPKDTGGKRQGLISAITDINNADDNTNIKDWAALDANDALSLLSDLENLEIKTQTQEDKHCIYVCASEFGSFIGQNNLELIRFLLEMWDCEDYPYQLKNSKEILKDPALTLIGGTTATDMSVLLPPEAIGQGFMSRCVLVFGPEKYKSIPPSKARLDKTLEPIIEDHFSWIITDLKGAVPLTPEASDLSDKIYMQAIKIKDPRFIYYSERRHDHLLKLAFSLAVLNKQKEIRIEDIEQANTLLEHTEETMPEALGEFGLSPLAQAKQKIIEFIMHANEPVTEQVLWAVMQRDMKLIDFRNCLSDLMNARKMVQVNSNYGPAYVYNDAAFEAISLLTDDFDVLTEHETQF